ncbi:hypothetical protein B0T26DRAFT_641322, partial [Lasiosphaeria miniovina]
SLPYDVYRLIFNATACIDDAVCLGLTNPYFWAIGRQHLQNYYVSLLGRWAGKNVVFVDNLIKAGDYPPGLLSAAEMDELNQTMEPPDTWVDVSEDDNSHGGSHSQHSDSEDDGRFTLYSFAFPEISSTRAWIVRNLRVSDATFYTADEPWILRNLTTKEFVRDKADGIPLSGPIPTPDLVRGPEIGVWGFGEVIMMRTCWTAGDGILDTGKAPMNLTRGPWAGHRFDIRTRASHDAANEHGWTDVSEQVAAESEAVWKEFYGQEWRETVRTTCEVEYDTIMERLCVRKDFDNPIVDPDDLNADYRTQISVN